MSENPISKKIAIVLLGLVLFVLALNVGISKYFGMNESQGEKKILSGIEIDKTFHAALYNYGFSKDWIESKKIKNISDDSLFAAYSIKVPKDVPIQVLILELKFLFANDDVIILAEEISSNKKSLIKITSGNKLKLAAELFYDENLKREYGSVAFLVYDLPVQNDEQLKEFFNTPELFLPVIIPSEISKKQISTIEKANKQFALLLNDDINELDYKLSDNYSDDRLKKSIKEIVGTFYTALFFIVDDKSDLFQSDKYSLIQTEILKRKISLIHSTDFTSLNLDNMNVEEAFRSFMRSVGKEDKKNLLLTADDFSAIIHLIPSFRKIGYRFVYPGEIILTK